MPIVFGSPISLSRSTIYAGRAMANSRPNAPFDSLHSNHGDPNDGGFFARNWDDADPGEDGEGRGYCRCSHGHGNEHTTLDYIQAACEQAGITSWQDLEPYVDILEGDRPYNLDDFIEAFASLDDAKSSIDAVAKGDALAGGRLARRIGASRFSAAEADILKKALAQKSGLGLRPIAKEMGDGKSKARNSAKAEAADVTKAKNGEAFSWLPAGYVAEQGSIWRIIGDGDDARHIELCHLFRDPALKRDQDGGNWGLRIVFDDSDRLQHERIISRDRLANDAPALIGELFADGLGVVMTKESKDWLITLLGEIARSRDLPRVREVNRPGWHQDGQVFVTPLGEVIRAQADDTGETIILADNAGAPDKASKGDLIGSRAVFAACFEVPEQWHWSVCACAAFAGPVQQLLGDSEESGGIGIVGPSGHGKTTGLAVQTSAWTNPKATKGNLVELRATINSLEASCRTATGTTLALNEAHHLSPKDYAQLPFMVAGGAEKGRMGRSVKANRQTIGWSVFAVINSEKHAKDILAGDGIKQLAGHVARFPETNISGTVKLPGNHPVLSPLAGYAEHYGHAGPAFVRRLIAEGWNATEGREKLRREVDAITAELATGDPNLTRPARKFALVRWVGEAARRYGLFPANADVAGQVGKSWQSFLDGPDARALQGVKRAIETLRGAILTQWEKTIVSLDRTPAEYGQPPVGYWDEEYIYVRAECLADLAGGTDTPQAIAQELHRMGALQARKEQYCHAYLPRKGNLSHYRLTLLEFGPDDAVEGIAEIDPETGRRRRRQGTAGGSADQGANFSQAEEAIRPKAKRRKRLEE